MKKNNPMTVLLDEHDIIRSAEDIINAIDKSWESNPEKYAENVKHLLNFFRLYSDKFHHFKEEDVLFKVLRECPDFKLPDIITELEEHHESFREMVAKIDNAINNSEWQKAQKLLGQYFNDLLDHIAVENDELFVMTESVLSDAELETMYFRFEDIDNSLGKQLKNELVEGLNRVQNA